MSIAIETEGLSKNFDAFRAVDSISMTIQKGDIYGFIGLNGAGKTTTIKMLLGMIKPTAGRTVIFGEEVQPNKTAIWKNVGYLVEAPAHYPNLTVKENLEIVRRLRMILDKNCVQRVAQKLKIDQYLHRKAKNLSQGNMQRLGIAKALIHEPGILILDEPTNALDPSGIVEIRNLLKDLSENHGVTVFVSSHILEEVAKFSTRIGIIDQGKLVKELYTKDLDHYCEKKLVIGTQHVQESYTKLAESGISASISEENVLEIRDRATLEHPEQLITELVHSKLTPYMIKTVQDDLEAFFLKTINQ